MSHRRSKSVFDVEEGRSDLKTHIEGTSRQTSKQSAWVGMVCVFDVLGCLGLIDMKIT
jgi:hypothetical protein